MVQNINNLELEIILVLLKNKTHLREIARILNESHSTILRKINEMCRCRYSYNSSILFLPSFTKPSSSICFKSRETTTLPEPSSVANCS